MTTEETKKKIWEDIINQFQNEEQENQRLPGEISVDDFLEMSDTKISREAVFKRFNKLVRDGKLSKRTIRILGRNVCLFCPTT